MFLWAAEMVRRDKIRSQLCYELMDIMCALLSTGICGLYERKLRRLIHLSETWAMTLLIFTTLWMVLLTWALWCKTLASFLSIGLLCLFSLPSVCWVSMSLTFTKCYAIPEHWQIHMTCSLCIYICYSISYSLLLLLRFLKSWNVTWIQ